MMTANPAGRSFLSYRRSRRDEARLLILAQHELGVPTFQDIDNLEDGPTEQQLRDVIADSSTANALLWITPDIAESPTIQNVELPAIIKRVSNDREFFVKAVAAGGLGYEDAGAVANVVPTHDLRTWNLELAGGDPIADVDAQRIAADILRHRMRRIHRYLPKEQALRMYFTTRDAAPFDPAYALAMDWSHHFHGTRLCSTEAWSGVLLPALRAVADIIKIETATRSVQAEGYATISSAVALGHAFLAPKGVGLAWLQRFPGGGVTQLWRLGPSLDSGFNAHITWHEAGGGDVAVFISVADDVVAAVQATRSKLPSWRAVVSVEREGLLPHAIESSEEAVDIANKVIDAMRVVRREAHTDVRFHIFAAIPVGLAVLIGQLMNTLGHVQLYEHVQQSGTYAPSVLLAAQDY